MTTKRVNLLAGTLLGSALLLGTAGLVLAQDPTSTPAPAAASETCGDMAGMMGGQGMMGGSDMTAMHESMGEVTCDPELMQSMHEAHHPSE
jgi:hypothetical protein